MMKPDIDILKKQIIYRCSYTGIKETDIIYKKTILRKINLLNIKELRELLTIFETKTDSEIFLILIGKIKPLKKNIKLFNKIIYE